MVADISDESLSRAVLVQLWDIHCVFLPCGRRAGWILRLSLLATSLWSVQQSAPHMMLVTLTSCLSVIPPHCHSQWDASEDASMMWAATWQNQQNDCAPSEDSDQPEHPPSLIRVFAVRIKKPWVLSYPLRAQRRLIRLVGCSGWSESSLRAHSFCWFCHVAAHVLLRFDTGKPYWWSADHAQHIFLGAEDHYFCICLCPLILSLLPKCGGLCQIWHWTHQEG